MARAAAMTALLSHELNNLSGKSVSTSRATQGISRDSDNLAKSANRTGSSINQLSGRLELLVTAAAALGPALVPIGGVGIAAVAGLANQFGAVAIAGGTAVLAFRGVGKALTAVDKASIQPTTANIEAARLALEKLPPAAQDLIIHLENLKPVLNDLRTTAANGLLPGVTQSIDELQTRIPDIQRILETVSKATGHLFADAGAGLASSKFDAFFTFLATEVPGTLSAVGKATGNLTHALAEMWMAFTPLNHDFNNWIVSATAEFDKFATGLSKTQGFSDFIDYVRTNGPQVAATAGALANALVQIAQAAAPIGGPILKGVEALANALANLANSDLGTPIMAAVSAMSLLKLATRTYGGIAETSFGVKAAGSLRGMTTALMTVTTAQERASLSSRELATAESERSAAIRGGLATLGKGAAVAAGLALATSGLGDKMSYSNTATLGLIGTIGGPYGAAAGAAIGYAMDLAKSNNDFADAAQRASQILRDSPSSFAAQTQAIDAAIAKQKEFQTQADGLSKNVSNTNPFSLTPVSPEQAKNFFSGLFGTSDIEKQQQAIAALRAEQQGLIATWRDVAAGFGQASTGFDAGTASLSQLESLATKIQPAMGALGISFKDLQNANPVKLEGFVLEIAKYNQTADSTVGRTAAFLKSLTGLNNHLLSTADSASALSDALNNLFGPKLNAEQAADALTTSLKAMEATLKGNTKTFQGNTKAALDNRAATRQAFSDTLASLTAQAQAGAGAKQVANSLRDSRARFIQEGEAAGFSAKQMAARAKALGLTPKLVETVFKAVGLNIEQARLRDLADSIHKLPKQVQTTLKQNGYDLSKRQIEDLTKKYHLTPQQVSTLLQARDKASALIKFVQAQADKLDKSHPNVPLDANPVPALQAIARTQQAINNLHGTTVTNYVDTVRRVGGPAPTTSTGAHGRVLDFYAAGDVRDRHVAEIAPAGSWRVWAEPETKGESYIPLADDWRRPRAQDIWRETGKRIGMAWMEYARGGLAGQPLRATSAAPTVMSTPSLMHVTGTIDTPFGPAQVRGIARQVVDEAVRSNGQAAYAGRRV